MGTVAFNMIFVQRLQPTAARRPVPINFVPVNTRKITLFDHNILLDHVTIFEVTQLIVARQELCQVLVIADWESEFNRRCQILDRN